MENLPYITDKLGIKVRNMVTEKIHQELIEKQEINPEIVKLSETVSVCTQLIADNYLKTMNDKIAQMVSADNTLDNILGTLSFKTDALVNVLREEERKLQEIKNAQQEEIKHLDNTYKNGIHLISDGGYSWWTGFLSPEADELGQHMLYTFGLSYEGCYCLNFVKVDKTIYDEIMKAAQESATINEKGYRCLKDDIRLFDGEGFDAIWRDSESTAYAFDWDEIMTLADCDDSVAYFLNHDYSDVLSEDSCRGLHRYIEDSLDDGERYPLHSEAYNRLVRLNKKLHLGFAPEDFQPLHDTMNDYASYPSDYLEKIERIFTPLAEYHRSTIERIRQMLDSDCEQGDNLGDIEQ